MTTVCDRRSPATPISVHPTSPAPALRVLVTLPWAEARRAALASQLGPGCELVDVHGAGPADVVICPPCSPSTLLRLHHDYPAASIVVVEADEQAGTAGLDAPVTRLLSAGADTYRLDGSPGAVASAIRDLHHRAPEPTQRAG